jgi:phosphoserine phosphatase
MAPRRGLPSLKPWLLALAAALALAATGAVASRAESLPSWNDGAAKQRILAFVEAVTREGGPSYVARDDRIAVFDNDGTLWVEKPTYPQVFFLLDRLQALAPQHPDWRTKQPFAAALARDMKTLGGFGMPELLELLAATHTGMAQEEFEGQVSRFFATAKHPRWERPFQELVYQPQLELMQYLRDNGFQVFIVTGGGRDFVREISEPVYGVRRHMVVGSAVQTQFEMVAGRPRLLRLPKVVEPIDDRAGKPVNIERTIGRIPILAVGNSDGDLQMLQYSTAHGARSLQVLVHHDDGGREYAYDQGAEKALAAAAEHGWVVASMKGDFRRVFPFEALGKRERSSR